MDSSCIEVTYTNTTFITTDSYGIGFVELNLSYLSYPPGYLCEYRNGLLRKVHTIGNSLSNRGFFLTDILTNNVYARNEINASQFIGNGSQLVGVHAASLEDNIVISSKIASGAVNSTHLLDASISAMDISSGTINSTHILDAAISGEDLSPSSVSSVHIADASILAIDLSGSSVNSTHILDSTIQDDDISDSINLTIGNRITFGFGEFIESMVDDWINIVANLNVTDSLEVANEIKVGGISNDGSNRIVCIKPDGNLGTCSSTITGVGGQARCTCT